MTIRRTARNGTKLTALWLPANQCYAIMIGEIMINEYYSDRQDAIGRLKDLA